MDKASIAKIIAASCMGIVLAALIAVALFSDIPISLQVLLSVLAFMVFLKYENGLKSKF